MQKSGIILLFFTNLLAMIFTLFLFILLPSSGQYEGALLSIIILLEFGKWYVFYRIIKDKNLAFFLYYAIITVIAVIVCSFWQAQLLFLILPGACLYVISYILCDMKKIPKH